MGGWIWALIILVVVLCGLGVLAVALILRYRRLQAARRISQAFPRTALFSTDVRTLERFNRETCDVELDKMFTDPAIRKQRKSFSESSQDRSIRLQKEIDALESQLQELETSRIGEDPQTTSKRNEAIKAAQKELARLRERQRETLIEYTNFCRRMSDVVTQPGPSTSRQVGAIKPVQQQVGAIKSA